MTDPKKKLLPLIDDVNKKHIDYFVTFLSEIETPKDLSDAMFRSDKMWGTGYNQMFGPMMIELYKKDENVRKFVHEEVSKLGIEDDIIELYFTNYVNHGAIAVNIFMGDTIPVEKKPEFIKFTNQLMLDILKDYAGID